MYDTLTPMESYSPGWQFCDDSTCSLAVSRALGDYEYKKALYHGLTEQLVSPETEVCIHDRLESEDEFLVLACDGLWDVMSNEALCAYIHSLLQLTDDLVAVTNQVIDTCLYKVTMALPAVTIDELCHAIQDPTTNAPAKKVQEGILNDFMDLQYGKETFYTTI